MIAITKNEYYNLLVRAWALDANQDDTLAGVDTIYETWTDTVQTENSTVDTVLSHFQTNTSGHWVYQADDSTFRDQIATWQEAGQRIGLYFYENDY